MAPQLILGTASFGMDLTEFQDADSVANLLGKLEDLGINRVDTAARYPPLRPGRSEELIGEAMGQRDGLDLNLGIDTKVYTNTATDGSGDLSREALLRSLETSSERLKRQINVLYSHRPDPSTPLEEQIQTFNEQIELGTITSWGVANTPLHVLKRVLAICEEKVWQKPLCYQGHYSLISRAAEKELLPLLRRHNMSFVVYQILEAGFLTGKFLNNQHAGTRFDEDNPLGKLAQGAFADETLHAAVKKLDTKVKEKRLTMTEVAVRLAVHQLGLGDNDAVIIGASKPAQLEETVRMIRKGPLPAEFLDLADELWATLEPSRGHKI
ncbi:NADP-dependent oxidoreductase domain protein [Rhypophila sp. PSN 637]